MDLDSLARFALMAVGIGLVIFVHELGHFLAARACGVRVDVFSLGFGPKLLGWKRGDTLYQLALLPLGGYCRMAGEDSGDGGARPAPWELRAKPVGQRFFIYSGGVLANLAFGFVVLPVVLFWGVRFDEPLIGYVEPGSPAWLARIEPGSRVLAVNGTEMIGFEYIASEIALGPPERAELTLLAPDGTVRRNVAVAPRYDEEAGHAVIGVGPAADPTGAVQVLDGSPAARAGLVSGERIAAVEGSIEELPLPDRLALAMSGGVKVALRVRGADGVERRVEIEPERRARQAPPMLGVGSAINVVRALRDNADVAALGLAAGDRIVRVNGRRVLRPRDFERALLAALPRAEVTVERGGERVDLALEGLDRTRALALAGDVALASDPERVEVALLAGSPAERAGILDGDRLLSIDGVAVESWKAFQEAARAAGEEERSLAIDVARESADGSIELVSLTAAPGEVLDPVYGLALRDATYVYRATSVPGAIRVGVRGAAKFVTDAWLMLKRMLLGQVSSRNMGGIISIGVVSYHWAGVGWTKLVYFLCLLSLNLAFINVLPVPVLDGGHLFFLTVEKVKGSPVSPRVLGYSQTIGLVLILTLLIWVTYWDVDRFKHLFFGP